MSVFGLTTIVCPNIDSGYSLIRDKLDLSSWGVHIAIINDYITSTGENPSHRNKDQRFLKILNHSRVTAQVFLGGTPPTRIGNKLSHKNGHPRWLEQAVSPDALCPGIEVSTHSVTFVDRKKNKQPWTPSFSCQHRDLQGTMAPSTIPHPPALTTRHKSRLWLGTVPNR